MKRRETIEMLAYARTARSVESEIHKYSRIAACGLVLLTTGIFVQLYYNFMWVSAVGIGLLIAGFTRRDLFMAVAKRQASKRMRF